MNWRVGSRVAVCQTIKGTLLQGRHNQDPSSAVDDIHPASPIIRKIP